MEFDDSIKKLPKPLKTLIFIFVLALGFGYLAGYKFLMRTTSFSPQGIETNYNGNEDDEQAEEFRFKKPEKEILNIIHSHVLSLSVLFLILAFLVYCTGLPSGFKNFLMIEPFVSLIATFGGIWLLSAGVTWLKYVIMISGIMMTFSVFAMLIVIGRDTFRK